MIKTFLSFFILLVSLAMIVHGQQNYLGSSAYNCDKIDSQDSGLYTCNGQEKSCKAFLIFKARPPFNTFRKISSLTSSSPKELSRINNEADYEAIFPTDKQIIVPVNCSCSGQYYQANSSVKVGPNSNAFHRVANELFKGLTSCKSLMLENRPLGELDLRDGLELKVPLRCACPTKKQIESGTDYLLTYPVNEGDNIPDIAERFNVSSISVFNANSLSESDNPTIFTDVSVLIPLPSEPLSSQAVTHESYRPDDEDSILRGLVPLSRREIPRPKRIELEVILAIVAGCSVLVLVLVIAVVCLVRKKRSSNEILPRRQAPKSLSREEVRVQIATLKRGLRVFGIEEIKKATEEFSPENIIKGSVYRGVFGENNTVLAVKKKKQDASKEVAMLERLNHFNLTKLEGVCTHHNRFYMVFEYMENGSLREWLLRNDKSYSQSWTKRIQIALDVAHGLNYLHSFTEPGYVHKNIKTSNILLNKDMRAKIANFGLAGPAIDQTTSHVVGTRGYVAPEYLANGISTTKIDVFAFGVVVLELLSGKKAMAVEDGKQVLLSSRIVEIMDSGDVGELDMFVDCILKEHHRFREFALRFARLSVACLNRDPLSRPSMSEIVSSLSIMLADIRRIESSDL